MSQSRIGARRRASAPRRVRADASSVLAGVLVLLALAAVLLTMPGPVPPEGTTTATGEVVDHTLLACPDQNGGRGVSRDVSLGLSPRSSDAGLADGGPVTVGPVGSAGSDLDVPRGHLVDAPPDGGPKVDATGDAAAGLFAFRSEARRDRSLGVADCPEPRSEWWFAGAGAGLDHGSTLLLANVDPGPAVVDLRVLGPDGPVDTVGTSGITVPPGTVQRIELSQIAPQTDELAVDVHANRGRVVAAVSDSFADGPGAEAGQEWLAGTDRPSRAVRLDGLPRKAGKRTLLVANPGELEAVVKVRVAGAGGLFVPTGLDTITVPPGAVERVDLRGVLPAKETVALRLFARVPVVAAVRSVRQADSSYATAVRPLVGPAAAPALKGADTTVQLTAGAVPATVDVAAYDKDGKRVAGTTLSVDATATKAWSPKKKAAAYVLVTPEDGAVHGAVTYAGGGIAAVPLVALPLRVLTPTVEPALH